MKRLRRYLRPDQGQDSFEYLFVVGAIVVPLLAGLIVGFELLIPGVVDYVCPSVDTAANPIATVGSCITHLGG